MGDFNLSPRKETDKKKILDLCEPNRYQALNEITRRDSSNQLDHILVDKMFETCCFTTSFFNFISDHKSIVVRIGENGNELSDGIKSRIHFDSESHLKTNPKMHDERGHEYEQEEVVESNTIKVFERRIVNPDLSLSSCWLNACLQMLLIAMDQSTERQLCEHTSQPALLLTPHRGTHCCHTYTNYPSAIIVNINKK